VPYCGGKEAKKTKEKLCATCVARFARGTTVM
jgi:hypothetical protein